MTPIVQRPSSPSTHNARDNEGVESIASPINLIGAGVNPPSLEQTSGKDFKSLRASDDSQNQKDKELIAIATDEKKEIRDRIEAAKQISDANCDKISKLFLDAAKDIDIFSTLINVIRLMPTQEMQEEVWSAIAIDENQPIHRNLWAFQLLSASNPRKAAQLSTEAIEKHELKWEDLSKIGIFLGSLTKDQRYCKPASANQWQDLSVPMHVIINGIKNSPGIRDKIFVELLKNELALKWTDQQLEEILNTIEDPDLKFSAHTALLNRERQCP